MLTVGVIIMINLQANLPTGHTGMTEEETIDLMIRQQENKDMSTIAGILMGVGFMLILISFGTRRKGNPKKTEVKPVN